MKSTVTGLGRGLKYGAVVGLATGLLSNLGNLSVSPQPLIICLIGGSMIGSLLGLCFGVVAGFLNELSTVRDFVQTRTALQKLKSGILFHPLKWALVFSLASLIFTLSGQNKNVSRFVPYFAVFGLIVGVLLTPLFKHVVLRYCFAKEEESVPFRYVAFLDWLTELRILERDGGQWRFRHQILQNYFAELHLPDPIVVKHVY